MATLSKEQAAFLSHHNISESEVLDATNMRTKDYKKIMSEQGYRVAIGVTPCLRAGHTMRAANGHCVMCKPANLMYRKRFRESGYVYIATTKERHDLIKVGYCKSIEERELSLNTDCYGGYSDWSIKSFRKSEEKGVLEHAMHKALQQHSFSKTYFHDGQQQIAAELFKYDLGKATALLETIKVNQGRDEGGVGRVKQEKRSKATNGSKQKASTSQPKNKKPRYREIDGRQNNHNEARPTHAKASNSEPKTQQKRYREIDGRKNRHNEAGQVQEKTSDSAGARQQKRYREIDSRSPRYGEVTSTPNSNHDRQENSGMKWYHWFLLYVLLKALFVLGTHL
jgi:hypothetical protein